MSTSKQPRPFRMDRTRSLQTAARLAALIVLLALLLVPAGPASAATPSCVLKPVDKADFYGIISADGNVIAYGKSVDVPGYGPAPQYYTYQRLTGQSQTISQSYDGKILANDDSYFTRPAISDNGRLVVFFSNAIGMVPEYSGDMFQLYARDTKLNTLELVTKNGNTISNSASWTPALSTDGRYVAFQTDASNLDPTDTNHLMDTYVKDRKLGTIERVSIASDGSQGQYTDEYGYSSIDISGDGRYVVFNSMGLKGDDGVVHDGIFLRDRQAGKTYFIAQGYFPVMTPDTRYIVFETNQKLLPSDQSAGDDLYLYDRTSGTFELITVGPNGVSEGSDYYPYNFPVISADGSQVAFGTRNPHLVSGDTNNAFDIFVRNRTTGVTERLSRNVQGQEGNGDSFSPSISADGRFVTFTSRATNLLPSVTTPSYLYVCERTPAATFQGSILYLPLMVK